VRNALLLCVSSVPLHPSPSLPPSAMSSDLNITSTDIDRSRFTVENHRALKEKFPNLDDTTIARYLIARNGDLAKATELLTKAEAWRSKRWPVLKQDCLKELRVPRIYVHGRDKEGRPLVIVNTAQHDVNNRDIEECAKASLWWMEHAISQLPDDKSKYTILVNRSGSAGGGDIEFTKHFSKLFQDQHPERMQRAIVYPSGIVFWSLWNILKWFFDPVTREKVKPVMYLAGVQEFIDDDNIPASIGGKNTFEYNIDNFSDPYPPEVVEEALRRRETMTASTKTFFEPEDADTGNYETS
jgi:hypothetical protein